MEELEGGAFVEAAAALAQLALPDTGRASAWLARGEASSTGRTPVSRLHLLCARAAVASAEENVEGAEAAIREARQQLGALGIASSSRLGRLVERSGQSLRGNP